MKKVRKKMGRPKLKPEQLRDVSRQVAFRTDEARMVDAMARKSGKTFSAWARAVLLSAMCRLDCKNAGLDCNSAPWIAAELVGLRAAWLACKTGLDYKAQSWPGAHLGQDTFSAWEFADFGGQVEFA